MNRKQALLIFVLIIAFLTLLVLIIVEIKKEKLNQQSDTNGTDLDITTMVNLDSTQINPDQINAKKPTMLVIFSATCGACEYEMELLNDNINEFKHLNVILLSSERISKIKKFIANYPQLQQNRVIFAKTTPEMLAKVFPFASYPTIVFYDKSKDFKKYNRGSITLKSLLEIIEKL